MPSVGIEIGVGDAEFVADLPARRNGWGIAGAVLFGIPWLLAVLLVSAAALFVVDPSLRGRALLALFIAFVATILISALAAASVWYALYTVWGRERLHIDLERLSVTREVLRMAIPFRARRGFADRIVLIEDASLGAESTHYRLEAHAGRSKIRFAAGATESAAREIQEQATQFIDRTRDRAVLNREGARSSSGVDHPHAPR